MGKVREYKGTPGSDRRAFLRQMKNLGIASAAAVVWGGIANSSKASIPILRPPGAMPERQFLKSCIKCGLCVEVCPYHALRLAAPGDQRPIGTPYFLPRQQPCRMCMDVPCVPVCPTGAISLARIEHDTAGGTQSPDINCARMGLAVISRDTCVAYWGIQCDACYRVCPLMDKALTVEFARNDRTGKHAILAPIVHGDACTGCGMCEHACVTKKASIFILPRDLAMGESDARYIKGWDKIDEERMQDNPEDIVTRTKRSEKAPVDYLNTQDVTSSE